MAFLKWHFRVLQVSSVLSIVALNSAASHPSYCSNNSVSCSSQLLHVNASDSACRVVSYLPSDCAEWTFNIDGFSPNLGSVVLKTYPYTELGFRFSVFNVTFTDIKWTSLRFRFKQHGYDNKHFCREFQVSSEYSIPELFYDCLWTQSNYEGTPFTFEYEARSPHHTEARRYVTELPFYKYIGPGIQLQNWTSFLYVDVSELPALTAKWQQAHSHFGVQKYKLEVFNKIESSGINLQASEVILGTDEDHELSYKFETFFTCGDYHIEVYILSDNCINGMCKVSRSPDITVQNAKLPVVLIIYTPSHAAHIRCMVALTEYLRNCCFVEALLDQLDIPDSETKDPFIWCNEAFSRADFVMVVSSPPKCCNQEGIFRNVDVVALRFLKEKFSEHSSRPEFFSVLMPYCTEQDIPDEARNLRLFKLTKDFDKMLWYIHNGGRFPTVVDSARSLLEPKPRGGKSDLNSRGNVLLGAIKEAEYDVVRVCNCKNLNLKEKDDNDTENTRCLTKCITQNEEENKYERTMCNSNSTHHLLVSPEPLDMELPFLLDDLDLTGTVEPIKKNNEVVHSGVDLNSMKL